MSGRASDGDDDPRAATSAVRARASAERGDLAPLAAAFDAHARAVTTIAARVLRDDDAARDVCQEAFVRLHAHRDALRGDPGPWLRAVAWRLSFDALRRRRRERGALERRPPPASPPSPADATESREDGRAVVDAVLDLSDRQREVLLLRVVHGETFPAVARAVGVSEGSAKTHLRRALERLRARLGPPAPVATSPTSTLRAAKGTP